MRVREYEDADLGSIRACLVTLQEDERALDARLPRGEDVADAYLDLMRQRCRAWCGTILVAERADQVVGFVSVYMRVLAEEPSEGPREYGLVSDLVVLPAQRGAGIGRGLLAEAENRARAAGVRWLRVGVLAANESATALYARAGYHAFLHYLEKELSDDPATAT